VYNIWGLEKLLAAHVVYGFALSKNEGEERLQGGVSHYPCCGKMEARKRFR